MTHGIRARTRSTSWWIAGALLLATGSTLISACGTRLDHSQISQGGVGVTSGGTSGSGTTTSGDTTGGSSTGDTSTSGSATSGDTTATGSTGDTTSGTTTAPALTSGGATSSTSSTSGSGTGSGTTSSTSTTGTGSGSGSGTGSGGGSTTKGATSTSTSGTTKGSTTSGTTTSGTTGQTSGTTTSAPPATTGLTGPGVINHPIFGGTAACTAPTGSVVAVGNDSTLSGVLGVLFSAVKPAMQLWAQSMNQCGGLNGHKVQLYVADDQDDPSTAVSQANDLIQNKHILAFVGNIQVLTIDAMLPLINKTKIPMIGGDLTNNTWFASPYIFPQGPPPGVVAAGYAAASRDYFKTTKMGDVFCFEVPQACKQIEAAFQDLAPKLGQTIAKTIQVSITAPSYTSQCLSFQSAGVQTLALTIDAPSQARLAASCDKVGYHPNYVPYPLGVGNEGEFFAAGKLLANAYVPLNTFPWMTANTPAEKYYQKQVANYSPSLKSGPGSKTGDAASLGWSSGALMTLASQSLPADNPQPTDLLKVLYTFKNQAFTQLGGLVPAPLDFSAMATGGIPVVPYCSFATVSNADNSGWDVTKTQDKATCTALTAAGQPK